MVQGNKATGAGKRPASDDELKLLLGDDYETYSEFRQKKQEREARVRINDVARAMCSEEGGKYFVSYSKLEGDLNAVWEKALAEATDQVNKEAGIDTRPATVPAKK